MRTSGIPCDQCYETLWNHTLSFSLCIITAARIHNNSSSLSIALGEKCLYSELFWSAFSRIRTEYGEILHIFLYSVQMRKSAEQNNSEYGLFYAVLFSVARIVFYELILYKGHESNKCLQQKYLRQRINSLQIKIYRFHWTLNLRELWFKTSES